ncbi:uncharacterized protein LOC123303078 [Chrysoperla carnea]|uniref:uncharacterized protein LOC123303078 n=1 Tax=Chrysoperla carnea TaxID=189513 RepID=UPI001D06D1FD|nr:uncharacterized protein LOC123303078 [Chrysoperla carnea]
MWKKLIFIVVICSQAFASVDQAFTENEIVSDVIDVPPYQLVEVKYPSGGVVKLGNYLTPTQVLQKPSVKFTGDPSKYYLLCMTDPDAPSRAEPTMREFEHWLVGNIPGDKVCYGETIADYIPSAPPENTGYHRYIFLIYEQPGYIQFDEPRLTNTSTSGRPKFSIRNLAKKYGVGDPIFGNFYQAQYDESVPSIYAMLDNYSMVISMIITMWKKLVFIVVIFSQAFASVDQAFTKNEIVPDVVDVPPYQLLEVKYPSGVEVNLGNNLNPTQVLQKPQVKFNGDPSKYYLLAMVDPDAPSRAEPKLREIEHWVVGNIPGDKVCRGETIAVYIPPTPPMGTGYHRYVFLIYEQPGHIEFDEARLTNISSLGRTNFSIRNLANKYGLGEPIFGNFFQSQFIQLQDVLEILV